MLEPKKYWKRIAVEAMHIVPGSLADQHAAYLWVESIVGSFEPMAVIEKRVPRPTQGISIDPRDGRFILATPRGLQWANDGDWIIRGPGDMFYARKQSTFDRIYDEREDQDAEV